MLQDQLKALSEIQAFLEENNLTYFVIGGLANSVWGRPRFTRDADVKVLPAERTIAEIVAQVGERFRFRVADPLSFALATFVVPIYAGNGIDIDIGLGFLPYEELAATNAVTASLESVSFRVCTAEDLIIHKAISERPVDWRDIEGVLAKQAKTLDQDYIERWLRAFSEALERPTILDQYRAARQKARV